MTSIYAAGLGLEKGYLVLANGWDPRTRNQEARNCSYPSRPAALGKKGPLAVDFKAPTPVDVHVAKREFGPSLFGWLEREPLSKKKEGHHWKSRICLTRLKR